ncbi:Kinesin light chain [Lachnellula suecica]|uniref:Kinesin light chain n=1 Tax=Lachnellula suecica TaxID=602035 RepID=A0A8T9CIX8_9HELO|nr:Kinesin light chain [Lachnellula suecica]
MAEALAIIGVVLPLAGVATKSLAELCRLYASKKEMSEAIESASKQLSPHRHLDRNREKASSRSALIEDCQNQITKLSSLIGRVKPVSTGSRTFQTSKKAVAWRFKYGSEFKDIMARINSLTSTITGYLTMRNGIIMDETLLLARKGKEQQYTEWLQPCEFDFIGKKLEGTCGWIWNEEPFSAWIDRENTGQQNRLLCIHGVHGTGKSVLASSIVDSLKDKQFQTLFFSFCGADGSRKSVEHLLRTILWQQLQRVDAEVRQKTMQELMEHGPINTSGLLQALIKVGNLTTTPIYCIVDGIDESNDVWSDPSEGGLNLILRLRKDLPYFRILLLGRPAALWEALRHTDLHIEMTPNAVKEDIRRFIHAETGKLEAIGTEDLRAQVKRTLEDKSDGIFLWVKMMFGELRKAANADEVEKMLCILPRGLHKAYSFLFGRLLERLGTLELNRAQSLLQIIMAACRPLSIDELCYTYALVSEPGVEISKHLMPRPDKGILDVCGDFITISSGTVRLGHMSVKEFLTRPKSQFETEEPEISCFHINLEDTNRLLGSACLRYLADCEYGFPLSDGDTFTGLETQNLLLRYATRYGSVHLMNSGNPTNELLKQINDFLASRKASSWIEYLLLLLVHYDADGITIDEFDNFTEWYDRAIGELCLDSKIDIRLKEEIAYRKKVYGDNDVRTETWGNATVWLRGDNDPADDHQSLVGLKSVDRPHEHVSQALMIFGSGIFSVQSQARLVLSLARVWNMPSVRADPLDIIFNMMLSMTNRLPIYALLGIGNYYYRNGELNKALKLQEAAMRRLEGAENKMECVVLNDIGYTLHEMKKHIESEQTHRKEVLKREHIFGASHRTTLDAKFLVARQLFSQGRYDEAEVIVIEVAEKSDNFLGEAHALTLNNLRLWGSILYKDARFEEAERPYRKVFETGKLLPGDTHKKTIDAAVALCCTLERSGKLLQAEMICREVAEMRGKLLGESHIDTIEAQFHIGRFLYCQRKYEQAADHLRKKATAEENILARDHNLSLQIPNLLGKSLYKSGKFAEAIDAFKNSATFSEETLWLCASPTISSWKYLGLSLFEQGEFAEAIEVFQKLIASEEENLGLNHSTTLYDLNTFCHILYDIGDYGHAEVIARDLVHRYDSAYGSEHMDTTQMVLMLGYALARQGKFDEAMEQYQRTVKQLDVHLEAGYFTHLELLTALGRLQVARGNDFEAVTMYKRAGRGYIDFAMSFTGTVTGMFWLSESLLCQGKYSEAEETIRPVINDVEMRQSVTPKLLAGCRLNLAEALENQEKYLEAEVLYRAALEEISPQNNRLRMKQKPRLTAQEEEDVEFIVTEAEAGISYCQKSKELYEGNDGALKKIVALADGEAQKSDEDENLREHSDALIVG